MPQQVESRPAPFCQLLDVILFKFACQEAGFQHPQPVDHFQQLGNVSVEGRCCYSEDGAAGVNLQFGVQAGLIHEIGSGPDPFRESFVVWPPSPDFGLS